MSEQLPKGVSYDLGGLTVRKAQTRVETISNLLLVCLLVGAVCAYASLGFPEAVRALPEAVHPFVVDLISNLLLAGPLAVPLGLYLAWHFATQPILRLTQHTVTIGPRWARWRPTHQFQLGSLGVSARREPWEETTDRAVLCLTEGEKTARLPLEPIVENETDTGMAKLDWLVREIEAAQAAFGESERDKEAAKRALEPLRRRAGEKRGPHR